MSVGFGMAVAQPALGRSSLQGQDRVVREGGAWEEAAAWPRLPPPALSLLQLPVMDVATLSAKTGCWPLTAHNTDHVITGTAAHAGLPPASPAVQAPSPHGPCPAGGCPARARALTPPAPSALPSRGRCWRSWGLGRSVAAGPATRGPQGSRRPPSPLTSVADFIRLRSLTGVEFM